jgi:hypothetical protein
VPCLTANKVISALSLPTAQQSCSQRHSPKRFRPVANVAVLDPKPAAGVELLWLPSGAVPRFTLPSSAISQPHRRQRSDGQHLCVHQSVHGYKHAAATVPHKAAARIHLMQPAHYRAASSVFFTSAADAACSSCCPAADGVLLSALHAGALSFTALVTGCSS